MGGALLGGWLDQGVAPASIVIVEPADAALPVELHTDIIRCRSIDEIAAGARPEIILFAVKPQVMDDVAPPYARFAEHAPVM